MLDVENIKNMIQYELDCREESKADWEKNRISNDTYFQHVYEKIYIRYRSRFNGMCDLLFEMGYIVFIDDGNVVRVEKRSNFDNLSDDEEIPF